MDRSRRAIRQRRPRTHSPGRQLLASHRHDAVFCSSDAVLIGAFSRFIAGELREGNAVVAVVTAAHERRLQSSLEASHVDVALAIRQQRYLPVDVTELLAKATVNGCPDPLRYWTPRGIC